MKHSKVNYYYNKYMKGVSQANTKLLMRKETLDRLLTNRQMDVRQFVDSTLDNELQQNIEKYLNALKSKSK